LDRYRHFNIQELLAVAARSADIDAKRCTAPRFLQRIVCVITSSGTHMMKYREGLYNTTFLLTFNNGSEVVAKLPNPNAGPKVLTIASEVATMDYVSSEFTRQKYQG
jgi:hypothetical protein